jgi:hypothetical protein
MSITAELDKDKNAFIVNVDFFLLQNRQIGK